MRYKAIFFDLDDTLLDYTQSERNALSAALRKQGCVATEHTFSIFKQIRLEYWKKYEVGSISVEKMRVERFEKLSSQIGKRFDCKVAGLEYVKLLSEQAILIQGAYEICAELHGKAKLAVITNGIKNEQSRRLEKAGLLRFFECVVASDELQVSKPDRRIYDLALRRTGCSAGASLMIGDSFFHDIHGAREAGLHTCWYNPHRSEKKDFEPHFEIQKLPEILNFLR